MQKPVDNMTHIEEAIRWIYRAQDATPDGGVSHSYCIGKGWLPSYPETTGYIIPTLFNWHRRTGDEEAKKRAIDMADWELTVQMDNGAIPSLSTKRPVVFDTGQVLFGWLSAFYNTSQNKYIHAAVKAGDWLMEGLDQDFVWRKHGNPNTDGIHTYNVRVAWALLELSRATGDERYRTGMEGFVDWALSQESSNGWFEFNCLNNSRWPLLHTIAYTAQGLLESGLILNDQRCIDATTRTADQLTKHISSKGGLPGRFDQNWTPIAKWACLTGIAQMSVVWNRLDRIIGDKTYRQAYNKANSFLKTCQNLSSEDGGIRGGIKGSFPINGGYCPYRFPNWAAKFFVDALILEEFRHERVDIRG